MILLFCHGPPPRCHIGLKYQITPDGHVARRRARPSWCPVATSSLGYDATCRRGFRALFRVNDRGRSCRAGWST
ncbi:unnamed protein product [[Actinomadura] parvosata subsp. kistnae]|nr:unnamed protein product [Actinomadura parvosata subsp. kistnae]